MAFSIRSALDNLVTLQAALTITVPVSEEIKRAYKTFPKDTSIAPDAPCFVNIPRWISTSHTFGSRKQRWQVRSQLLVLDADRDRAADIVLAFVEKYQTALSDAITLNGLPVILTDAFSEDLGGFEYGGKSFTGIEIVIVLEVPLEAVTVGP